MTDFRNTYEDEERAAAYAELEFPGTYYLAFRDLPDILGRYLPPGARPIDPPLPGQAKGGPRPEPGPAESPRGAASAPVALDFGCGAGRSTRFLRELGWRVTGVDISAVMLALAVERDPDGTYILVGDGDLAPIPDASCDLVLAVFTFDNIPTAERKTRAMRELRRVLRPAGRIVVVASAPELYTHDWASFRNTGFPENFTAGNGDPVYVRMLDVSDARPIPDILWDDDAYRGTFASAGLVVEAVHRPRGRKDEPYEWISEIEVAPWAIWVLRRASGNENGSRED